MELEIENKFSVLTKFVVYGTKKMAQQTNWLLSNHEDHVIVGKAAHAVDTETRVSLKIAGQLVWPNWEGIDSVRTLWGANEEDTTLDI